MVKVYLAKRMSGLSGRQLRADSLRAFKTCPEPIRLFDPVLIEGVKNTDELVAAPADILGQHWLRDKKAIRQCHVVIDTTGPEKSEGVAAELGYARFFLHKPVVRVYPGLGPSVARLEGDLVVDTLEEAYKLVLEKWGTRWKRFMWRLNLFNRCFAWFCWIRLNEALDWI